MPILGPIYNILPKAYILAYIYICRQQYCLLSTPKLFFKFKQIFLKFLGKTPSTIYKNSLGAQDTQEQAEPQMQIKFNPLLI